MRHVPTVCREAVAAKLGLGPKVYSRQMAYSRMAVNELGSDDEEEEVFIRHQD